VIFKYGWVSTSVEPIERNNIPTECISEVQATILKELIADGRKTVAQISKDTGLTKECVKKNYHSLEQMGIIRGATIHINYKTFGYKAVAIITLRVDSNQAEQLIDYVRKLPQNYFVYDIGPKGNISLTIIIKNLQELDKIKDSIKNKFSVSETKTVIWTDVREMHRNMAIIPGNISRINEPSRIKYCTPAIGAFPKKLSIDEIDRKIADKLAENGRAPMEEIAKEIGVSTDTANRRYERLKKNGALKVTIQFDPTKIGYVAIAVFFATTSNVNPASIIESISDIPDVISIMKMTGDYDLEIFALIRSLEELLSIRDKLVKIQGISRIDLELSPMPDKWPSPRQHISTF
jgi:DNA-binding Lrp family transcriptional regulator